ncbi:hypothetical protein D6D01_00910 [Aureobasidium pullulans]|uniref:Uncharacterized protein n=1 Tax=Aureobasidium pullulans TaxID=5580 RepID=A0A4S9M0L5_AURPU|nr:hypothetical protein D6D01_00910 [Aureobasidium pullulans]
MTGQTQNNLDAKHEPTMSSPPQPKRRRIGIHKPFISPLKRKDSSIATPENTSTPTRTSNLRNETTPESLAIRHLESRIRELRAQNAILQQAVATSTSTNTTSAMSITQQQQPSRLETKWRKASLAAADHVFLDFCTRIRDNGGYTAFLKQQSTYKPFCSDQSNDNNDKSQQNTQGDEEDWRDEMGDVLTARGKKQRRRENEDKVKKQEQDEEEQEEQELGMGSMLQVLNIPPEVIGWDEKEQAWK